MKMKRILEVMKVVSLIVNMVEVTEYLRHVFKSYQRPKTVKGFKTENEWNMKKRNQPLS